MIIKQKPLQQHSFPQNIDEFLSPIENHLLIDIETTGFSPKFATIYLIGCCYYHSNSWNYIQWFAETLEDESEILTHFFLFAKNFQTFVHFNGNQFDLPFLEKRTEALQLCFSLNSFNNIDLYAQIVPYKKLLNLPNCKQKTLETFLQIDRLDTFSGGELIPYYKEYVTSPKENILDFLLLHNKEDIIGMIHLIPILSYITLFTNPPKTFTMENHTYQTSTQEKKQELLIHFPLSHELPISISYRKGDCFFRGNGKQGFLQIPISNRTLKFFYDNYKEYYYLPDEDMAIHQSVASFVNKSHKKKATLSTCYTKKEGFFLPQWGKIITPSFHSALKDVPLYFEVSEEFLNSTSLQYAYLIHILDWLV